MTSKFQALAAAAALAALLVPAIAGGEIGGFRCDNMCPLATEANLHRSLGMESRATSKVVRAELAQAVERNLARV
jgi:hypothetical protein